MALARKAEVNPGIQNASLLFLYFIIETGILVGYLIYVNSEPSMVKILHPTDTGNCPVLIFYLI